MHPDHLQQLWPHMQSSGIDPSVYDERHTGMTHLAGPWRSSGTGLRMDNSYLPKPEDEVKKMVGFWKGV